MHTTNKYNPRINSRGKWWRRRRTKQDEHWEHNRFCFYIKLLTQYDHCNDYPNGIPRDPVTHEYILVERDMEEEFRRYEAKEWVSCNSKFGYRPVKLAYLNGANQIGNGAWHSNRNTRVVKHVKNYGNRQIRREQDRELQKIVSGVKDEFETPCYSNTFWHDW